MEHTEQDKQAQLIQALERLAFGKITDAIKLLFCDELNTRMLNRLDLFPVSEIKRLKGGGMEIKFYDRLKALQYLQELYHEQSGDAAGLYHALEQGVRAFEEDEA